VINESGEKEGKEVHGHPKGLRKRWRKLKRVRKTRGSNVYSGTQHFKIWRY
jgi:hypothetical protein